MMPWIAYGNISNSYRAILEGVNIHSIPCLDHRYTILRGGTHMINEHSIWH